jgi:hypothetical protein
LLQAMMALERDLEKAGAALGGGLSVVLQPVRALEVTARADDREESVHRVSAPRAFEADRAMRLSIDGVAAFEIAVGSAEARRAVDALRERWRTEAIPVLEKAGVDRLSALGETAAALAGERAQLAERRRSADQLRSEAKNLRQQAAIRRDGAASPSIGAEEIEARRTAIGAQDLATLEARWMALKKAPERTLEQLHEALQRRHREQRERVGRLDEQMRLGAIRVEELSDRAREAESLRQDRAASLPPGDLDALAAKAAADVDSSKRRCAALEAQEKNVSNEAERTLEKVESTLAAAATALEQARVAEAKARSEMSAENSRCNAQEGALGLLRDQVDGLDRPKAESDLRTLEAALAAIPPGSVASAEELAAAKTREREARRVHGEVREALMAREGALTHVGGAALREDVQRLEEARAVAEAQERALEVDAQAWKLLRETLREVENEEGTHLGRALAGPVTTRFEELTRGRYQGFRLDQALRAETIEAVGAKVEGQDVLASLSVGTRSQLATLVRLTVADQLKTTIVLDDHLVHTDVSRLEWFHDLLRRIAVNAQIIVITCRPQDYLAGIDVPVDPPVVDLASGLIRSIDLRRILERHASR